MFNLYDKVFEFVNIEKMDIVIDVYFGIGIIILLVFKYVKKVYGLEINLVFYKDVIDNKCLN